MDACLVKERKEIFIDWHFDGIENRAEVRNAVEVLSKLIPDLKIEQRGYQTQIMLKITKEE